MAEIRITEKGKELALLCEKLIAHEVTASFFCERVDILQLGEFHDEVSAWEETHLLDNLQDEIEFYEPDPRLREHGLYGDEEFIEAVKKVYEGYLRDLRD